MQLLERILYSVHQLSFRQSLEEILLHDGYANYGGTVTFPRALSQRCSSRSKGKSVPKAKQSNNNFAKSVRYALYGVRLTTLHPSDQRVPF